MDYSFTEQAYQELKTFPPDIQRRIILKIKHYLSTPDPLHFADHIKARQTKTYRFRIGDYRAIFDWRGDHILVTKIARRSSAYH